MEGTYTSQEAISEFVKHGLSSSRLYRRVKEGKITKYLPDDKQRGAIYSKVDVDRVCSEEGKERESRSRDVVSAFKPVEGAINPLIDVVRKEDLARVFLLENEQLGFDEAIPASSILSWLGKDDHVYWLLTNPENRKDVWAVLGILPLREELIAQILRGELLPRDIRPDDLIVAGSSENDLSYYITSATTLPSKRSYITDLMQRLLLYWCERSPNMHMGKVYMISQETMDDDPFLRLVKECFFSPLYDYSGSQDKIVWELRFDLYNPSPLVQSFQECLQQNLKKKEINSMIAILPKVKETVIKARERRLPTTERLLASIESEVRMPFRLVESDDDILSVVRIGNAIFGASNVDSSGLVLLFKSWLAANKEIFHVLEDDEKNIVGFASILPLTKEKIDDIVRDEIRITDVKAEDILPFEPGLPVNMFVHVAGIDPAIQGRPKRTAGKWLFTGVMEMFHDFGERGIEIKAVYARSGTNDGINSSLGLGFREVAPPPGVTKRVFEMDVSQSEKPFLIDYMHALDDYRNTHVVSSNT